MLTTRTLNRTTLARQLLLERHDLPPAQAIEHLVGLQAQATSSPYLALWSRLEGFDADVVGAMLVDRTAVRTTLMRGTLHLVTARDCVRLRPVLQPMLTRTGTANFARGREDVDLAAMVAAARPLLDAQPLTNAQLGAALTERWPGHGITGLGTLLQLLLPLVQVPPRGVFGRGGAPLNAVASTWLGTDIPASADPDEAVLRYLAAFGPATAADVTAWSRLTNLRPVIARLDLTTYRDEAGRVLLDVPDGVLTDPETPVPPRFLPDFDNVLLSHADRTRIMSDEHRKRWGAVANAVFPPSFLLDGFLSGTWKADKGVLTITPYRKVSKKDQNALTREGLALLDFLAPGEEHDVRFAD
ncbi:winged helix DNA-binding domain-containing protein [Umezawaea endophytica]|uniref:Winged helix DNA-binding domain-containing protein n=1 Tax=Umezawaea endophytica TaxID=1654476 RepID=A0A9X2VU32_9PSEU|nr:winged helix DNA-binding domain-containing protein [Umezawaea endophytica]MCS7482644.1 winged helix DNA-binding domain-containing protein [Umezawaea endophytica]